MRRCDGCIWWKRLPPSFNGKLVASLKFADDEEATEKVNEYGQCRRAPPRISERTITSGKRQPVIVTITEFPDTPAAAWCGEWTSKENEHGA